MALSTFFVIQLSINVYLCKFVRTCSLELGIAQLHTSAVL